MGVTTGEVRARHRESGRTAIFPAGIAVPDGFDVLDSTSATAGPSSHPWVQMNQAARQGQMPSGESIGDAAMRGGKIALGIEAPTNLQETVASLALPAAATMAGGFGAPALASRLGIGGFASRLAPAAGRVAAATTVKAAQQDMKGEDVIGPASLAAAEALLGEGIVKALGTALRPIAKPANVLNDLRRRLAAGPDASADVPLLDTWVRRIAAADEGARPMEVQRAVEFFKREFGDDFAAVFRGNVAEAKLGVKGVGIPIPAGVSEGARAAQRATRSNAGRAAADTLMTQTPLGIISGKLVTDRLMK